MKKIILIIILSVISNTLIWSQFDIKEFTDINKYDWGSKRKQLVYRNNLLDRQKLLQIYEYKKQSTTSNMLKSMVVPGWGHFSARRYTKGEILLGLEIILLGSSLYFYDQSMEIYSKYKDASYIENINQYYNDAKIPYGYSQGFLGLGIILWIYTIYDSTVATDEYNQDLWQNIFFDFHENKLQITPTGITWRF